MDSLAQLALMAKAKLVFESPGTFLSFPAVQPVSRSPEELQFGKPGTATAEDLREQTEFARIVNEIPRGVLAPTDHIEYLWDVYGDVLRTAQFATGALGEEEKAHLARTRSFLYEITPEGIQLDGPALRTYRQYRDANFEAQEEYKNQQLTAEASDDPVIKDRWRQEVEPRLRTEVKRLADEWLTQGFKAEVEAALQTEQAYAARAPSLAREEWLTSYMESLDHATDTTLMDAAVTSYSPYDAFEMEWPRFTLSRSEIERLIRDAPTELKKIFQSDAAVSTIESLSFQYRSVAVTRPWFHSTVFKSRFWRLPPAAEQLSDGTDLAKGRCPAYISALVFARNIEIKFKEHMAETTPVTGRNLLRLQAAAVNPQLAVLVRQMDESRATPSAASVVGQPAIAVRDHRTAAATASVAMVRDHRAAQVRDHRAAQVRDHRAGEFSARPRPRPYVVAQPVVTAPNPEPAPPRPQPEPTNEVMILAFICRQLSQCPNPDLTLSWT
jgi:hypothetical protein